MTLRINGQAREIPPLETVAAVVAHLGLPAATLLIEHNGVALRRDEWATTQVGEGDTVEFLQIAAGG